MIHVRSDQGRYNAMMFLRGLTGWHLRDHPRRNVIMFVRSGQIWYVDVIRRGLMRWHFSWSGEFWCNDVVRSEEIWCDDICVIRRDLFLCHLCDQERSYRMALVWSEETWCDWMIRADLIWWCDQKRFDVTTFVWSGEIFQEDNHVIRRNLICLNDQGRSDMMMWSGEVWCDYICVIRRDLTGWHSCNQKKPDVIAWSGQIWYDDVIRRGLM